MYFFRYLLLTLNLCYAARGKSRTTSVATRKPNLKERFKAYERYAANTTVVADNMLDIYYERVPTQDDIMRATIAYFDIKTYFKGVINTLTKLDRILDSVKFIYAQRKTSMAEWTKGFQIVSNKVIRCLSLPTANILESLVKENSTLCVYQLYSYANSCHEVFKEMSVKSLFEEASVQVCDKQNIIDRVQSLISILRKEPPLLDPLVDETTILRISHHSWRQHKNTVIRMHHEFKLISQQNCGDEAAKQGNLKIDLSQFEDFLKFLEFIIDLKAPNEPNFEVDEGKLWFELPKPRK